MAFKSSERTFEKRTHFTDSMTRFIADEAVFASSEEDANAKMDAGLERIVRHSADKDKSEAKVLREEIKAFEKSNPTFDKDIKLELKALKEEDKALKVREEKLQIEQQAFQSKLAAGQMKKEEADKTRASLQGEERFCSGERTRIEGRKTELKEAKKEKDSKNKKKSDSKKKAATKMSVANFLKGKKDLSNELANNGDISGNAFTDGNKGVVGAVLDVINPMTYLKKFISYIAAAIAPYVLVFSGIIMVVVMIVAILVQVLSPIQAVSNAIDEFLSWFTFEEEIFYDYSLSEDEIDEILADITLDEDQEAVVRYAMSKVGYPYSQSDRCSGSAYDCSSLAYYSWQAAGVDISYGAGTVPSAAEGARIMDERGLEVMTVSNMKPGDLVYYGGSANGRYLGIYHVAIYIGDGLCVEALNSTYGVVLQELRTENAIMVIRPN